MLTSLRRMVFVYARPVDMRKSYDGLFGLVRDLDPLSGNVFLFLSRDLKRAKAMFWDGSGLNIWMKRIEQGRFANIWLRDRLTASELKIFFEGSKVVVREISPEDRSHKYLPRPQN